MTETARIYGGSLYDLAAEENLTGEILGQMEQIRTLLRENPVFQENWSERSICMTNIHSLKFRVKMRLMYSVP